MELAVHGFLNTPNIFALHPAQSSSGGSGVFQEFMFALNSIFIMLF
jgi:hypothetical protein